MSPPTENTAGTTYSNTYATGEGLTDGNLDEGGSGNTTTTNCASKDGKTDGPIATPVIIAKCAEGSEVGEVSVGISSTTTF